MMISPNRFSPIRKLFGSRDHNGCKRSMKYASYYMRFIRFYGENCKEDFITTSKILYSWITCISMYKTRWIFLKFAPEWLRDKASTPIIVLSLTYQTDNSNESNFEIKYAGNMPCFCIFGIYSTSITTIYNEFYEMSPINAFNTSASVAFYSNGLSL